jgi:hypothetical protein
MSRAFVLAYAQLGRLSGFAPWTKLFEDALKKIDRHLLPYHLFVVPAFIYAVFVSILHMDDASVEEVRKDNR